MSTSSSPNECHIRTLFEGDRGGWKRIPDPKSDGKVEQEMPIESPRPHDYPILLVDRPRALAPRKTMTEYAPMGL